MESILRIEVSPVGMKVRGRSWGIHLMSELSLCLGMDSLDNRLKLHAYPTLSQIFFFFETLWPRRGHGHKANMARLPLDYYSFSLVGRQPQARSARLGNIFAPSANFTGRPIFVVMVVLARRDCLSIPAFFRNEIDCCKSGSRRGITSMGVCVLTIDFMS
jgi:hypothetical protein